MTGEIWMKGRSERRAAGAGLALRMALLALAVALPAAAGDTGVYTLHKDGREHRIATVTRDGGDFLSLTDLARALGGRVSVDPASHRAQIELGGSRVTIAPGEATAELDGERRPVARPALLVLGRIYVPTEFVTDVLAAALKRAVKWKDQATSLLDPEAARTPPIEATVEVQSLRDYTRVLFRFPGASVLPYTVNNPRGKIVLRVQADNVSAREREVRAGDGALERVVFETDAGRGSFTLELGKEFRDYQPAVLRDPFRVVIDLYRKSPYVPPAPVAARPAPAPAAAGGAAPRPAPPTDLLHVEPGAPPAADGTRPRGSFRTVVVDPGHGGIEPGAKGAGNLLEKDLTLDIARRLAAVLEQKLGLRVVMTRSSDVELPLDDRTGIANHEKADLFISIHANASLRKNARGAETYFLSRNASDDESRKLAALENSVVGEAKGLEGSDLELILWNLAQNQYLKESEVLAEAIQKELNELLDIPNRGVKQAPFKVLVGATMPAVLVEVGFITNPAEEKLLRDDGYKDKLVAAIFRSVVQFKQSRDLKMGSLAPPARP